jgi:hypothetical protein
MREQDAGVKWFNTVFYPQRKTGRAVRYEDGVLPRLRAREVTLFTPWGPRYGWEKRGAVIRKEDKETQALNFLAGLLREWECKMPDKTFRWVFLGADLYGTRINNLPGESVSNYFTSLAEWLTKVLPAAEFRLWSESSDAAEKYRRIIRKNFEAFVDFDLLLRANRTARVMRRGGDPREYLVERLAEAMFVEEILHPIKISCVARRKDDKVDWDLPRLYFLPEPLQAPWL